MMPRTLYLPLFCLCLAACRPAAESPEPVPAAPGDHAMEAAPGAWITLFDGSSTEHFRGYLRDDLPAAWSIEDGTLALDPSQEDRGDIITRDEYDNFELSLEWKISEGGNSGIIYLVHEDPAYGAVWQTGPEMQVLDDAAHADGTLEKHRAGDLYDLIASASPSAKPVGEWNQVRIVLDDGHLEHWLNGGKVVDTQLWTDAWDALVAGSKFADMDGFGKYHSGHIALQDHGDRVWYRNIKIRRL